MVTTNSDQGHLPLAGGDCYVIKTPTHPRGGEGTILSVTLAGEANIVIKHAHLGHGGDIVVIINIRPLARLSEKCGHLNCQFF